VGKIEVMRLLGRPWHRWEVSIKMDVREIGWNDGDWINLTQDMDHWKALVNTVLNIQPSGLKNIWTIETHLSPLCPFFLSFFLSSAFICRVLS
jgi:hypothetical protein